MDAFPVCRRFTRYFRGHFLIMAALYHKFCQVNTHCLNSFHGKSQFSIANCLISRGYLRYTEMMTMKIPWKSNETSIFNRKIPSKAPNRQRLWWWNPPVSLPIAVVAATESSGHMVPQAIGIARFDGFGAATSPGKSQDELQVLEWWGYWQLFYQW